MNIRPSINSQKVQICADSGSGRDLTTLEFLEKNGFKHKIYDVTNPEAQPILSGWNSPCPRKVTRFAEMTFFTPGFFLNGRPGILQQTAYAWLVETLGAGMILGVAFYKSREATLDLGADLITFPQENFNVPIVTVKAGVPVHRRVWSKAAVIMPAGQTAAIPVEYYPLPKGRSFSMEAEHPAVHIYLPCKIALHGDSGMQIQSSKTFELRNKCRTRTTPETDGGLYRKPTS
ncbi:hypothetical protein GGTG_13756 [Gaeumannomyces tritici R3-111a-1]|uniref:Uncharacterized protein n=1 Tax=Gaeumannomyces tritici (strain R3-111a-1) TaxID=644352 RepID=J3PJR7_GAET3|nr:hypothetical protein GGTG_13756 [Gaeumannomyces tritici R3-111a-1]EJT68672.1 hypothetical protein GGTG_13756 [Gaeumannomyces tritici R3-111a-1]